MKLAQIALILIFALLSSGHKIPHTETIRKVDLKPLFHKRGVKGGLVILDAANNIYNVYNSEAVNKPRSPASTFKIANTLIALETGVAGDSGFTLHWDSVKGPISVWNRDQSLRSAFQVSCVWYYREIARRIGIEKMQFWLNAFEYGNANTGGGVDLFWLTGKLRISAMQQIDFLKKLRDRQLGLSDRTYTICRQVMLVDSNAQYTLLAKTGMGEKGIGWYVGYFETAGNVYYFANCIQAKGSASDHFLQDRKDIVFEAMKQLGYLKP